MGGAWSIATAAGVGDAGGGATGVGAAVGRAGDGGGAKVAAMPGVPAVIAPAGVVAPAAVGVDAGVIAGGATAVVIAVGVAGASAGASADVTEVVAADDGDDAGSVAGAPPPQAGSVIRITAAIRNAARVRGSFIAARLLWHAALGAGRAVGELRPQLAGVGVKKPLNAVFVNPNHRPVDHAPGGESHRPFRNAIIGGAPRPKPP